MSAALCTPYLPETQRVNAPHPAPLYLREDYQPFLDRDRPHVLLHTGPGAKLPADRRSSLRYRYEDTGEEVQVPNAWHNQTREMRISYWAGEVKEAQARIDVLRRLRARTTNAQDIKALDAREARFLESQARVQQIMDDVQQGIRFV